MSKGIIIALVDVSDPEAFRAYGAQATAAVAKHGGRYIARGGRPIPLAGDPPPQRALAIRFPTLVPADASLNS